MSSQAENAIGPSADSTSAHAAAAPSATAQQPDPDPSPPVRRRCVAYSQGAFYCTLHASSLSACLNRKYEQADEWEQVAPVDSDGYEVEDPRDASASAGCRRRLGPFPLPFDDVEPRFGFSPSCLMPRTLRELALMRFAGAIREKPHWFDKVHDQTLCSKWVAEAKEQDDLLNDQNLTYMLAELRWQAATQRQDGMQPAAVDGVWQADGVVEAELKAALVAAVGRLEDVAEEERDYHPGSNRQVVNLVHPSLYCLRIGETKVVDGPIGLADCLHAFGTGSTHRSFEYQDAGQHDEEEEKAAAAEEEEGEEEEEEEDHPHKKHKGVEEEDSADGHEEHEEGEEKGVEADDEEEEDDKNELMDEEEDEEEEEEEDGAEEEEEEDADMASQAGSGASDWQPRWKATLHQREYSESLCYAWLPSEFAVDESGKVTIQSYINNLHPVEHAALYPVLERICERFVPLWERVLTDLKNPAQVRVDPGWCNWWRPPADRRDEHRDHLLAYLSFQDELIPSSVRDGLDPDEWEQAKQDYWRSKTLKELMAEVRYDEKWFHVRPIYHPDISEPFQPPAPLPPSRQVSLRGRTLQVIVKLANIELTPTRPFYPGGSWHVEGMRNESIVASGIYYYHSDNISESRLAFRQACQEPPYEQYDHRGVRQVYGLVDQGALSQTRGACTTKEDRLLAFPNIYQHQVQPFWLADRSKPGVRKILVFFLVDPDRSVMSTASVPPQQRHWLEREREVLMRTLRESTTLADNVSRIVIDYLIDDSGVIDSSRAQADRQLLMDERKYFVGQNNEKLFERQFSLCEH